MTNNLLATIPGEHIAKAAAMLPDASSATDEPYYVEIKHGHWICITFKRFQYRRGKTTRWFWTADSAVWVGQGVRPKAAGRRDSG